MTSRSDTPLAAEQSMPTSHPTAVIESGAQIADDAVIGPLCHVGPEVAIGPGTRLISHVSITGRTTVGSRNTFWPHSSIGADPQDLKFQGEDSQLIIGDDNEIRESVTIHKGTVNGGGTTRIGNCNLFMAGVHVAHDCIIGDHVIVANAVQLAGHVHIQDHATVSGASAVNHYVTIGQYAFVGGMTRVVNDAPPYMIVEGNPARIRGVNVIGLERSRLPAQTIGHLKNAYRRLFRINPNGEGEPIRPQDRSPQSTSPTMAQNIDQLEREYGQDHCIGTLITFIRDRSVGVYGRRRENDRADDRHHNPTK